MSSPIELKLILASMRLYNWPAILFNTAAISAMMGAGFFPALKLSVVISCLASFGFLVNDLWDRHIDSVNKPGHFENAHRATTTLAVMVACFCLAVAAGLAWRQSNQIPVIITITAGLTFYTFVLRRILIIPTLVASALGTSPVWVPLILWPKRSEFWQWIVVLGAGIMMAGREILMDVRDRSGDRAGGRTTLPIVFGTLTAQRTVIVLTFVGTALLAGTLVARTPYLVVPKLAGGVLSIVLLTVLVLVPASQSTGRADDERDYIRRFEKRSRIGMLVIPVFMWLLWQ